MLMHAHPTAISVEMSANSSDSRGILSIAFSDLTAGSTAISLIDWDSPTLAVTCDVRVTRG
jgi:hypothetical protein